ncbi:MAG: hypothetical protein AAF799_09445 [Myxococcota bacterium]
MSTSRALRAGLAATVTAALLVSSSSAHASPWALPSSASLHAAAPAQPDTLEGALESGDLDAAEELAAQAREADPSAANWQREGEVLEQSGEYQRAAEAYREAKKAAGEDAEAASAADEGLARVSAAARGTVADEPASTHREQLDERWAPKPPPKPEPKPEPPPVQEPASDRIVNKWYFWVTVGAIVASAAAVTTIAIRASRDDQPDALDSLTVQPGPRGLGVLRF